MGTEGTVMSDDLHITEEQYLALYEATDSNYEFYNGYVVMVRPPSSLYDTRTPGDMAGGSPAHAALCICLGSPLDQALADSSCTV